MNKSKCYLCRYKGVIPGDAHICCDHPLVKDNTFAALSCLISVGLVAKLGHHSGSIFEPLNIQANEHGIKEGWFNWPLNFDPVWLENCNGFSKNDNLNV